MATASLSTQILPRLPQGGFANEPFVDFRTPENARAMQAALDLVAGRLGREYDLINGGRSPRTEG
jgi:1-pyrroline-5-carboxylate dehydrogenase